MHRLVLSALFVLLSNAAYAQQSLFGYFNSLPIVDPTTQAQILICPRGCSPGQPLERLSLPELPTGNQTANFIHRTMQNASSSLSNSIRNLPVTASLNDGYLIGSANGCAATQPDPYISRFSQHRLMAGPTDLRHEVTRAVPATRDTNPTFASYFCALPEDAEIPALDDQAIVVSRQGVQRIAIGNLIGSGHTEVYYSMAGNNANSCLSPSQSCRDPERAKQVVQTLLASNRIDVTVYGGPGTYHLSNTMSFGPSDSPPTGGEVVWTSLDPDHPAHWSGSKQVTGPWTQVTGVGGPQQYKAHLDFAPPPATPYTPDGTLLYPWQSGELHNKDGTWSWGPLVEQPWAEAMGGSFFHQVLLNGNPVGFGFAMYINNGGTIFLDTADPPPNARPNFQNNLWLSAATLVTTRQWINGQWLQGDTENGLPLDRAFELYVNGTPATLAQIEVNPNHFVLDRQDTWSRYDSTFTWNNAAIGNLNIGSWHNLHDVELYFRNYWNAQNCPIKDVVGQAITVQWPCDPFMRTQGGLSARGWRPMKIMNAQELLPQCGIHCWYYNRTEKELYYIPAPNENINNDDIEVPAVVGLMKFDHAANISFNHMVFEHSTWMRGPDPGGGYVPREDTLPCSTPYMLRPWAYMPPRDMVPDPIPWPDPGRGCGDFWGKSAIYTTESSRINFIHDRMSGLANTALTYGINTHDSTIESSQFINNPGACIHIGQTHEFGQVHTPPFPQSGFFTTATAWTTVGIRVNNSECVGPAFEYDGGVAIWRTLTSGTQLSHNLVRDWLYGAIWHNYGWGFLPGMTWNNITNNNRIIDACLAWNDCGSIKSMGMSADANIISENYVDSPGPISPGSYFGACFYDDGAQAPWPVNSFNTHWIDNVCNGRAGARPHWFVSAGNIFIHGLRYTGTERPFQGTVMTDMVQFDRDNPPPEVISRFENSGPQNTVPGP